MNYVDQIAILITEDPDVINEDRDDNVVLYHIGKRPPRPAPSRKGSGWWRQGPGDVAVGVFLTPNPVLVNKSHGIKGHVYAVKVPRKIIKMVGGIRYYDYAPEILIPEELWKHVKFLGKVMDRSELENMRLINGKDTENRPTLGILAGQKYTNSALIINLIKKLDLDIDSTRDRLKLKLYIKSIGINKLQTSSRRSNRRRKKNIRKTKKRLQIGMIFDGVVTDIHRYGAFVDIGIDMNALIHISNLKHASQEFWYTQDAGDFVHVGDRVRVRVLEIDFKRNRVALKQLDTT